MFNWYSWWIKREYLRLYPPPPPPVPIPTRYGEITRNEIRHFLPDAITIPNGNKVTVRKIFFDPVYRTISKKDMEDFLRQNQVNKKHYVNKHGDCDDFAIRLWGDVKDWCDGICIGFLWTWSPSHAKNIFIDIDKVFWEIEPQSDLIEPLKLDNIYTTII